MRRFTLLVLTTTVIAGMPWLARAQDARPATPVPVVVTQGEAILKRAPDRAWLNVATETRAPKADDARRMNAATMTDVQKALRGAGLSNDAIRTTGYTLSPDMEWNNGRGTVKGYIVRNQIEVRVDDIGRLGDVIDAAMAGRTTTLTITGPRFDLKNQADVEREALGEAVQAGMARAQAIAAGAHRTLGAIVRIDDQNFGGPRPPQPYAMQSMAKAGPIDTPVTPGEIEVRAQVTLTVELK
jgi:uncharacterized protein YggE